MEFEKFEFRKRLSKLSNDKRTDIFCFVILLLFSCYVTFVFVLLLCYICFCMFFQLLLCTWKDCFQSQNDCCSCSHIKGDSRMFQVTFNFVHTKKRGTEMSRKLLSKPTSSLIPFEEKRDYFNFFLMLFKLCKKTSKLSK